MLRIIRGSTGNLSDVSALIESLATSELFEPNTPVYIARAPGRLDVMGGIADYSGSLVLEMPIREAAVAAVQKSRSRELKIISRSASSEVRANEFSMTLDEFETGGEPIDYAAAQEKLGSDRKTAWAAYIAGAFLVLMREKNITFECGAAILIDSKVPEGKGVSSSAAIEIAALSAIAAAYEIILTPRETAILCQKIENSVVGAPCGIMDQMTSVCGEANRLTALLCQPAELLGARKIPDEIAFWGVDSGIRHSVGAGDYGSVRTGAFMGYRIIADLAGLRIQNTEVEGVVRVDDDRWRGYLANIAPTEFEKDFAAQLPFEMAGADFLRRYGGITDTVTRVTPDKIYAVLPATAHPIYENFRVRRFAEILSEKMSENNLKKLGKLMAESHASYSACGLGSDGTDLLVELVKKSPRLHGAKITGGGSGGTVAILGRGDAGGEIEKVAEIYRRQTGYEPYVFSGSSIGAAEFGVLVIK